MKVRIKETPREAELDGVRLDIFLPGTVREVSATIGNWLMAQGYAESEMRFGPDGPSSIDPRAIRVERRRLPT